MLLDFFPSGTLTWYLAKTFVLRILAVLAMLVLVLLMLDLLGTSGNILEAPGNGQSEVLRYAGLRIPQLVSQFLPYSVLLATIITLTTLSQNSEVVSMKAAGLSAHQILAPLLLTAAIVSGLSLVFNERVVTRATATLKAWEGNDFAPVPDDPDARSNVYLNDGSDILLARLVTGSGADTVLTGVTYYVRDAEAMIVREVRGSRATFADPGWRLEEPSVFDVATATARPQSGPLTVAPALTPEQVALRNVDPDAEPLLELSRSIEALKDAGRRTAELEAKWWHKLSGPLAAVLMPLLGAVAGFGLARSGHLFARAVLGMMLGFAFFVVDNAALALGSFGGYPPLLAAWAPFLLFLLVGETVLVRTEE